jgi:predicted nucleic acid-binding protein
MADRILLDTNVVVYAYDRSEPEKQARAFKILERLQDTGSGVLTTQVLAEFFTVVTRKLRIPLGLKESARQVELLARSWPVFDVTTFTVIEAVRGVQVYHMSYWDAQIWASALLNQVSIVFSEDFRTGSVVEGVRFVNPFEKKFELP